MTTQYKTKRPSDPAKYTGLLNSSFPWDRENIGHELTLRMELLFDHYRVTRDDWSALCMALAMAHVPGFKRSRRGRKPSRKLTAKRFRLWWDAQPNKLVALASLPESLAAQAFELGTQPRAGRPRAETSWLVREADNWLHVQREAGKRHVSDRKFVVAWLLESRQRTRLG